MSGHSTSPADLHKADVKAALEKAGWTLRSLAASLKLNPATLTRALTERYPASERRIADALGKHPMEIWPSRYTDEGQPNGVRGKRKRSNAKQRSTRSRAPNGKSSRAG